MMTSKYLFALVLLAVTVSSLKCNATTGNYLSPHSLGRQNEMINALAVLCKQIKLPNTTYGSGKTNYTIFNVSVECVYNDAKQVADIYAADSMRVSGGKIEFLLNFNYSTSKKGPDQYGYAYASSFTDNITFAKHMIINLDGYLQWVLALNQTQPITMLGGFPIKRTDPREQSNDTLDALDQALNKAISSITPKTVKSQILELINTNFTDVLNQTLTQEKIFTNLTQYTFSHPYKQQELSINLTHSLWLYNLTDLDGFSVEYITKIQGVNNDQNCTVDIPEFHESFQDFGGIQTIHAMDLYRQIAYLNLKNKWLDSDLGPVWETNSFQFYAGDLFDVIPNAAKTIPPRAKLAGSCQAIDDSYFSFKRQLYQSFLLTVNYSCYIETSGTGGKTRLAQFYVQTSFSIGIALESTYIKFTINDAKGIPHYKIIPDYIVTDQIQANFKISQALKSLKGYQVFGTGYHAWPRDFPGVQVRRDYILFFDSSHIPHMREQTY